MGAANDQNHSAARQAGMKYIVEPQGGEWAARNTGARSCLGQVVAYLDEDSLPEPDWLENLLEPFATPAVMIVAGHVRKYSEPAGGRKAGNGDAGPVIFPAPKMRDAIVIFERLAGGVNVAVRRAFFDEFGGFDERLDGDVRTGSFEKSEIFFRLVAAGYTLVYEPKAIVQHP
jgi:cellulose synthase/poly-beta-1,6-N-acetylglucosamine synthase-like glycosyltransferase